MLLCACRLRWAEKGALQLIPFGAAQVMSALPKALAFQASALPTATVLTYQINRPIFFFHMLQNECQEILGLVY